MFIVVFVMLYPFWNTIVISFNDAMDSIKGGLWFWPRKPTFFNYKTLFQTRNLIDAFWVSVSKTVIVTVLNVFCSAMAAYILSRKEFVLRNFMTKFIVATMYVNAGLIPQYFLYRSLGLINNYLVYIIPVMLGAFNVMVIRTFIHELPESLAESAKIDGAGEFRILYRLSYRYVNPSLQRLHYG